MSPSDILGAIRRAIQEGNRDTLPVIADMAEDIGYADQEVLLLLRTVNLDPSPNNLHWFALRKFREYLEEL